MNPTLALMKREWMQHRFAWSLLLLIPVALALLGLLFGTVDIHTDEGGLPAPLVLAASAVAICMAVLVVLATVSGLVTTVGLARRDHADRSVEFWLSLPLSHSRSLLVPMLVHLVLLPLAALAFALLAGLLLSMALMARTHGLGAWFTLPWSDVLTAAVVALVRLLAGWPLAVLWLSPIILLAMLMYAWLRRWGLVVLGLALSVGLTPLGTILGYHLVPDTLARLGQGAAHALISGKQMTVVRGSSDEVVLHSFQQAPSWVLTDIAGSLENLASPVFLGGLLFAALCFAGLVHWRRRGASVAV
jgi:ABC-2 type transport system permease protein